MAKYGYYMRWSLCALSEDGALKVPDDRARMHVHGFSFLAWRHHFKFEEKRLHRGKTHGNNIFTILKKYSTLNSALDWDRCEYFSIIYLFFSIFSKPCARKKWHTFSGFGPTSFHTVLELPHNCLILDLTPRIIPKTMLGRADHKIQKRKITKFITKSGYTHFRSHISLTHWKAKKAPTSLSISSLNSFCSLAKISLYF